MQEHERLEEFREHIEDGGYVWRDPHLGQEHDGVITCEWWTGERKLTLFFDPNKINYLRCWGPSIIDDMDEGEIKEIETFLKLWTWLYNGWEN